MTNENSSKKEAIKDNQDIAIAPVLPSTGFVRQKQILGDKNAKPPIPPIIPVCPSVWWGGIKKGIYPQPVKLSANITAWRAEDIRELINSFKQEGAA
jgi:hypothetical protein